MSQIGAALENDTHLMPVLFADGTDRRRSGRIPLSTPVKVGPPNGTPYALVSASDLSKFGLFIDADRQVRVGARFSVEIELDGRPTIYIAEAEVAYNRDRANGSGFGVRFVALDTDAMRAIEEEVDMVSDQTLIVRDRSRTMSEAPTLVPDMGIEFSDYPEPEIVESALDLSEVIEASAIDATVAPDRREQLRYAVKDTRQRFAERARQAPRAFRFLAIAGGATLVIAAGLALFEGARDGAVVAEPITTDRGVAASTHNVLMGQAELESLEGAGGVSAVETPKKKKKELPPLVVLDDPPETRQAPTPVKKAPIAQPAPVEPAKVKTIPAPPPVAPKKPKQVSSAARKILGEDAPKTVKIPGIDPGARVLKTHVYVNPDRFVIDLVGQTSPIAPAAGVRTGRHPDFHRVVVDAGRPLEAGRVSISGAALVVHLHYE